MGKTWKIMKMNGILHQRASVSRLYLKRNEEGRGLRSINRRDNRDREVWIFRLWEKDKQRSQQSSKISEKGRHQKGIQGQYQETQTQRLDRETTAWTIP